LIVDAGDTSRIDKRHTFVTPELVLQHPELATYGDASLSTRVAIANKVIPEIAVEATQNAVREWGRPLSAVTHMALATTSATSIPGIDLAIARSLNLAPDTAAHLHVPDRLLGRSCGPVRRPDSWCT
jgi:predicted naringenin-chalcone synthase